MRKKSLLVLATAAVMVLGGAFTAHAEEVQWIKDPSTWDDPYYYQTEALEQVQAWATRHVEGLANIVDEESRYAACVSEVCNFLDYDIKYKNPHVYYTIRDGKGVCSDYTSLTAALCDLVGIQYEVSIGSLIGAGHDMLKVNINGEWRYSDPANYESGAVGMFGMTPGYVEEASSAGLNTATHYTGFDTDNFTEALLSAKEGYVPIMSIDGAITYMKQSDLDRAERGEITFEELDAMYGI